MPKKAPLARPIHEAKREYPLDQIAESFENRDFEQVVDLADKALKKWKWSNRSKRYRILLHACLFKKRKLTSGLAQFSEARRASSMADPRGIPTVLQPTIAELLILARTVRYIADFLDDNEERVEESPWGPINQIYKVTSKSFWLTIMEVIDEANDMFFKNKLELVSCLMNDAAHWLTERGKSMNRPVIAHCIANQAIAQLRMELHEDSIDSSDRVITEFSEDLRSETKLAVAQAFGLKALAFSKMGKSAEVIGICDMAVTSYGNDPEGFVRSQVIRILNLKARELEKMGRVEEAMAVLNHIEERYGRDPGTAVQIAIAASLANKVAALLRIRRFKDVIANADMMDARYRNKLESHGQFPVADIMVEGNISLRFKYDVDSLEGSVSSALKNRVRAEVRSGEVGSASATCDEIKQRFGRSTDPDVQTSVASSVWELAWAFANFDRAEAALRECKELEVILDGIKGEHLDQMRRHLKWVRIKSYTILGDLPSAVAEAQSAFAEYDLNDEKNINELLWFAVDALARNVPERVFLNAFMDDQTRLNQIAPLIVALRQRVGETVREPNQFIEIAKQIQKMIDVRKVQYSEFK